MKPVTFFETCEEIGLKIPQYNKLSKTHLHQDLHQFKSLGLFDNDQYYLNTKENLISYDTIDFNKMVQYLDLNGNENEPILLTKLIHGDIYSANVICKDGQILILQVSCLTNFMSFCI